MTIQRHTQLFRHDPDNGIYGDCFRTVIACLLRMRPEEVPHFCDGPDDGKSMERVHEFLEPLGFAYISLPFPASELPELEQMLAIGAHHSRGLHWVLMGKSRNGTNHVVICKGDQIIHDPSIDQSGIVGPSSDGLWWFELLVMRAPVDRPEMIEIDGRPYRKFIHFPGPVDDGTFRCIRCGQIDEEEFHDDALCKAGAA